MLLRKLELYGFKSFADRTEFVFEPGLTAILGPNGCGKSNVVDAIRWILGEQSAKSLRGNEMLDVVFSGTATRKSLGYAEASLSIDNTSRRLPIDYDEVCVTRRLYRSGESEYFLNKQPCRLKDIRELFMDTGIGMDAYSVIEQGKVDILLQANAQDRRAIFEEAAGISKYKAKKKAALSKLERVEQDLLRVQDILQEVQKQIRSIERQASKARRFQALTEELRSKELSVLLHQYHEAKGRAEALRTALECLSRERDSLAAAWQRVEAEVVEKETKAIELDRQIAALQAADSQAHAKISQAEAAIAMNRDRIRELESAEERLQAEIEQAATRKEQVEHEVAELSAQVEAAQNEIAAAEAALTSEQSRAHQGAEQLAAVARCIEEQRTAIVDILQHRSSVQNELNTVRNGQQSLGAEGKRLAERGEAIERELAELEQKERSLRQSSETLRQTLADLKAALDSDRVRQRNATERLAELTGRIQHTQMSLRAKESRYELLTDLEARREGLDTGVQIILEECRREGSPLRGIRGLVADIMEVPLEHAPAIESALGDRVQALVAERLEDAQAAMDFLRSQHKGRAAFVVLESLAKAPEHSANTDTHNPAVRPAREVVQVPDEAGPLADRLLLNTFLVPDLTTAVDLAWQSNGASGVFVTPRGELARSDGFLYGGNGQERMGVISRRSELRALEVEIAELKGQSERLTSEQAALTTILNDLQRAIRRGEEEISQAELSLARNGDELRRVESDVATRRDELEVGRSEIADIDVRLAHLREKQAALEGEVARLETVERETRQTLATMEQQRERLEQEKATVDEKITELRVAVVQQRERADSLRRTVAQQSRTLDEQSERIHRAEADIQNNRQRRQATGRTIQENHDALGRLVQERDRIRTELGGLCGERDALRQALEELRAENRTSYAKLQDLDTRIQRDTLRLNEYQYELRSLEERANGDCNAHLAELHPSYQETERDWAALAAEIEDIRRRREAVGPVNLLAIQELEELQEREKFLSTQYNDISSAKQSLQEAIRRINQHSRKLFEETFEAVRANFQVLFRKLFGGGKADIFLEPEQDVLEAGVEIVARPPGKEPRSITLLSGGEKVLTAIALLFAVFRARPSPFCVLDEVDAALDEQNIDRFITLLREFLEHSQFIVISHNKRTMSLADVLYGITMQEAGVSRKVSVKLTTGEKSDEKASAMGITEEAVAVG